MNEALILYCEIHDALCGVQARGWGQFGHSEMDEILYFLVYFQSHWRLTKCIVIMSIMSFSVKFIGQGFRFLYGKGGNEDSQIRVVNGI